MKRQSFRRPSFRRAACRISDFLNNYPKYVQNCFIFGYNMCFYYPDRFSFCDFWYFNLGGNYGPPKFFKILSLANLRLAINFLYIHRIASFLHIILVSNTYTKVTFQVFEFSILGEITAPPFFKILRVGISYFYDNFPKYAQNCFIFGYYMCF